MSPHDTSDADPAFRALRSRVDRLERAREQRLDRLERLVAALADETERQRGVLESVLDDDDPRLGRDTAVETLLEAVVDEGVSDVDRP
ncbi:hypothetical protein DM867_02205 [Halosegnis rubeus]|jgi:hypothetical protein|uniref:Uncharacterized protein n=1 Tax=Halosegnis rubeus TaxID=2212850 RepID=A0A5N5UBK9_9EURY|nr:hypothetical protein [Halosegnis rubeus]KAB7515978.1 hypothetical protein DM867_02205 [Halosegnis rubeus]KAB7516809.1 hypothetical protein DMP03_05445 [Halosegnis rubeus]KAB7520064.1 hypothetical protein DP108_02090 [Halosegnis rubeus]